jgi:hypothetical protein
MVKQKKGIRIMAIYIGKPAATRDFSGSLYFHRHDGNSMDIQYI